MPSGLPVIFQQSLQREFTQTSIMAVLVLLSILLTVTLVKLLGLAAGGALSTDAVLAMLAFGALTYLPIILSASVFAAILMTLTRSYRDSEMVIWMSSGVSLSQIIRPVLRFAVPLAVVVAIMSIVVSPWAIGKRAEYQSHLDSRDETSQITPGVFRESKQSDQVFFVDSLSSSKEKVSNVFVQSAQDHRLSVIAADKGYIQSNANGDRFVVLEQGRRYEGEPGKMDYSIVDFEQAQMRLAQKGVSATAASVKSMNLPQLMTNTSLDGWGELHWRIGLPVSLLVLSLFAIPLSYVNIRGGRSLNMLFAILAYMVYYNTMSIGQAWTVQGRIPTWLGIWPLHLMCLTLVILFLWHRQGEWSLQGFRLWYRRNNHSKGSS
jgi:lipopolysaccharide export system permease protein